MPDARVIEAVEAEVEEMIAPVQFFVSVSAYVQFNNNKVPTESDIIYKSFRGQSIPGVPWLKHTWYESLFRPYENQLESHDIVIECLVHDLYIILLRLRDVT